MPRCQSQVTKKAPALKPGQWKIEGPIMIDFISSQGLQPQTHQGNMKGGRRHVADELVLKFALCCDYNITILLRMACVSEKELHRDISSGTWSMSGTIIASGELIPTKGKNDPYDRIFRFCDKELMPPWFG